MFRLLLENYPWLSAFATVTLSIVGILAFVSFIAMFPIAGLTGFEMMGAFPLQLVAKARRDAARQADVQKPSQ